MSWSCTGWTAKAAIATSTITNFSCANGKNLPANPSFHRHWCAATTRLPSVCNPAQSFARSWKRWRRANSRARCARATKLWNGSKGNTCRLTDAETCGEHPITYPMRILMISAEGPPLKRAGALVDVMEALPAALQARGHEVGVVLPFYRQIRADRAIKKKDSGVTAEVIVGDRKYTARYLEGRSAGAVQLFFVRCDEFFDREGVYGEHGEPYEDNAARFIFFTKASLELARRLTPQLQILHVHDWPAALAPVFVFALGLPFKTVLTIHHVEEQGSFWGLDFPLTNLPERFFTLHGVEFFGRLNFLKGGILHADRITTVSEHYR